VQVPNLKGAESLSISEIAAQLWRLQKLAEEGNLHQEDLEGITTFLPAFLTTRSQLSALDWTVCCVP
jgi:pyruvate/2-oxoglutarate dehydrogenase complex dihydrolipoamide acyltransferase (E2) component